MTVPPDRAALLARNDVLLVVRPRPGAEPEIFLCLDAGGAVVAFNGHVDLGTGIRTALAQIVAEELDVDPAGVTMVLGDAMRAPDQGATIASETIQVTARPLRAAAAQARAHLVAMAAQVLGVEADGLQVDGGVVHVLPPADGALGNAAIRYADLIAGQRILLELDEATPVKPVNAYRVVGRSMPRVDIPAKATGGLVYVHDMRIDGMAHGRVVRPPYVGRDAGDFVGGSLLSVDEASVAHVPGLLGVVVIGDFVGVVAEREEHAIQAAAALRLTWKPPPPLPDMADVAGALRANPGTPRVLKDTGDIEAALAGSAVPVARHYVWPWQMHGSIGPSCALADWQGDGLVVWSGTQNPHVLQRDLAALMGLPAARVDVVRMEAAGCYGRNGADDVTADAALLSRAIGRPVRVQLSREDEHGWEPKGAAQLMEVRGGLGADGNVAAYDFVTRYPSNAAPLLAALLTGAIPPVAAVLQMGDRTAIPPYDVKSMRITVQDMAPIVRAAWLRGVSAMPNSFAHESFMDEMAAAAGEDPVAFRLRHLPDARGAALVQATAERAGWAPRMAPGQEGGEGDVLRGRGFAYAVYVHGPFPGTAAAWSAWVADVGVNRATGEVSVTRVVVGQDSGQMINPDGVRHQIEGNVIQSTSRVLKERVTFTSTAVASREWGGYPIITFPEVPEIDVLMVPRPDQPPLGVGESASVPSAAAIANAIYDATGVRFRELPFTPERILAGLGGAVAAPAPAPSKGRRWAGALAGLAGAGLAFLAGAASLRPFHAAIDPIAPPDPATWSDATIARGRALAALGNCATCHTAPGGAEYAGGRAIETPFGAIIASNITPDAINGIGAWSYPAFERAMRQGVGRDGRHLYPAFPYPSFTRASDADLQALYAYLMSRPAAAQAAPETRLGWFAARPAMAAWNAAFLQPGAMTADPARSAAWNRGAYLVEGLGHCGACHSPRNALGAERGGALHLGGGEADGWSAPALTPRATAPLPWTEADFHDYLRTGHAPLHGVAGGPMAAVVANLQALPDTDIRAMAVYLASFWPKPADDAAILEQAAALERAAEARRQPASGEGARIFEGACAACHRPGLELAGAGPSLALNSNLHADSPDNLIRVVLGGVAAPARAVGAMPGFAASLTDGQVESLLGFLRATFAPHQPGWTGLAGRIAQVRRGAP